MRIGRLVAGSVGVVVAASAGTAATAIQAAEATGPELVLAADAAADRGYITLFLAGASYADVDVDERVGGETRTVASVNLGDSLGYGGGAVLDRALHWRCDRLTRRFVATARNPDGSQDGAAFSVRTPSCRDRLSVTVPRAARPGARVRVVVRDRWRIGGVRGRLCTTAPGGPARCRKLSIPAGRTRVTRELRPRLSGRWRVEVRAPAQRIRRVVSVGVRAQRRMRRDARPTILATGDSLIQNIDALLADRLGRGAAVESDSHVGTGISKSLILDWQRLARRQVARVRPDATVVFVGSNDGFPMSPPGGPAVECCEEPWIAEYARRVRRIMASYAQDGTGKVIWLTVPAPRDVRRRPAVDAVNAAVLRAAPRVPGVHVIRLDEVFTPGGRYRAVMRHRGRRIRVREGDGIHLSVQGSAIATSIVIRRLKRFGPL